MIAADASGSHASLARTALRGLSFLLLQNSAGRVVSILGQLVVAWYVTPAEFGLIGLAVTAGAIAEVLVVFGFDDVLVQRGRAMARWSSQVRLIVVLLSLALALAIAATAGRTAALFSQPGLQDLLLVLACGVPAIGLAVVPGSRLRHELRFGFLALYSTAEILSVQALTILMAWSGQGAVSVILPIVVANWARAIAYTLAASRLGSVPGRRGRRLILLRAGSLVFASRIVTMLIRQGDYLILGLVADPVSLGAYYFAYRVASQPLFLLAGSVTSVLVPVLVRYGRDPAVQRERALQAMSALAYVVIPCGVLQAVLAWPLLNLVFGPKWNASVPLIGFLGIGLSFEALMWVAGSYMTARRRFGLMFGFAAINLALFVGVAILGATLGGAWGTALGVGLLYAILSPIECSMVFRLTRRELWTVCLRPALVAGLPAAAAWFLAGHLAPDRSIGYAAVATIGYAALFLVGFRLAEPALSAAAVARIRGVIAARLGGRAAFPVAAAATQPPLPGHERTR